MGPKIRACILNYFCLSAPFTLRNRNGEAGSGENMVIASWKVIIPVEWVRGHGTVYMCESCMMVSGLSAGTKAHNVLA
jgi:hypothetical protein